MNSRHEHLTPSEYIHAIRVELPAHVFRPDPKKLGLLLLHLAVMLGGYLGLRFCTSIWYPLWTLLVGHSVACIGLLSHELSHHAIIRFRPLRYACEVFFWGLNFIPATVWQRIHNQTHHAATNTVDDPDRPFLQSEWEESRFLRWYNRIFNPHHKSKGSLLVGLAFVPYNIRNIIAAYCKPGDKPSVVPFAPSYSIQQRFRIAFELTVIVSLQIGIFFLVGGNLWKYLWAAPFAYLVSSTVVMAYVFTQHWLNPFCETHDPLVATTSVQVHPFLDRLHHHFSHHVEHHLFPGMNSDHYPLVTELLLKKFPDRYHRLSFFKAWGCLWRGNETIIESPPAKAVSPPERVTEMVGM